MGYPNIRLADRIQTETKMISRAVLHPGQEIIAAGNNEGAIYLWDLLTGANLLQVNRHKSAISALRFAEQGAWLLGSFFIIYHTVYRRELLRITRKWSVIEQ